MSLESIEWMNSTVVLALLEESARAYCMYCGHHAESDVSCSMTAKHRARGSVRCSRMALFTKRLRSLTPPELDDAIKASGTKEREAVLSLVYPGLHPVHFSKEELAELTL